MRTDGIVRTCVGIVTAAMAASCAWAAHYYVAPGGTGNYTQASPGGDPNWCARNLAKTSGDVIHLAAGTYTLGSTPTSNQQIFLQPGVTLIGATDDPADTVIDGDGKYRAACCYGTASIRNLTMRNCKTTSAEGGGFGFGGAVCAQSDNNWNYVVSNCVVDGASATYKGGGGSLGIWRDCVIRNCEVTYPGYDTNPGSSIEGSGGGVWGGELHDCVVTNNYAAFAGGGVAGGSFHANDACRAYNCLIGWNTAAIGGGAGVRAGTSSAYCQLIGCTVVSNTVHSLAGYNVEKGGGVDGCFLTNCVVTANFAANLGGGLNRAVAVGCTVSGNVTTNGGTGFGGGGAAESVLTDCIVSGNESYYTGAGLFKSTAVDTLIVSNRLTATSPSGYETTGGAGAAESTLLRCTVEGNDAGIVWFGGGLRACEATDCLIAGNRGPNGGGGYNGLFVRCMVSNNVATTRLGGGIYNATSYNCVVTGNIATNKYTGTDPNTSWGRGAVCRGYYQGCLIYSNLYYTGAAVTAHKGATDITMVNCTVFGNRAGDGHHNGFGAGYATNCIVYGHPNTDVYNAQALVNSLWGVDMTSHGQTDPRLALAVNCKARVNPQFTMQTGTNACPFSLKGSSPARNAGLPLDWMTVMDKDILGNDRVRESAPDMGACEYYGVIGLIFSIR